MDTAKYRTNWEKNLVEAAKKLESWAEVTYLKGSASKTIKK